jgi:hypothetical protein
MTTTTGPLPPTAAKTPRDPRLDFFRGMAMFIILLAHTPGNTWTLWIPARFGFSDATEIFVFCSGMASSLAFGAVYVKRGWLMGTARVVFRVWQVYWAHIGVFLATATMLFAIDHFGIGLEGKRYITQPYVVPLFTKTGEALVGLFSLTYVTGLYPGDDTLRHGAAPLRRPHGGARLHRAGLAGGEPCRLFAPRRRWRGALDASENSCRHRRALRVDAAAGEPLRRG